MGKIIRNEIDYSGGYSLPNGGDAGQVLAKKSNLDKDVEWIDPPEGVVDTEMSDSSTNSVQNKVVKGYIDAGLNEKQDALTADHGIKIENDVISGTKVDASKGATNIIEVESYNSSKLGFEFGDDITLTASSPMLFSVRKALQVKLTAGENITIENNTISADDEVLVAVYEQTTYADVKSAIDAHKAIVLDMPANNNQFCMTYSTYTNGGNALMYAIYKMNDKPTLMTVTLTPQNQWTVSHTDLQEKLVSGTNIKTINNQSLLGSGNIDIQGGGGTLKTVNGNSLEGEGDIVIAEQASGEWNQLKIHTNDGEWADFGGLSSGDGSFQVTIGGTEYSLANASDIGPLSSLTTDDKTNLVAAINEVYEKSGEPFRVKQWASSWSEGVTIEPCTTDKTNTSLAKMTFSIDAVEGAAYQIVGMIAYEVFDNVSGGTRLNVWPVCQFTGNGQKELSVRWVCAGTTVKTAKRINAWVLLKHR